MADRVLTPDHVPCRHCGRPISWDEYCWTHDDSGFADCGITIGQGTQVAPGVQVNVPIYSDGSTSTALPEGDWR